MDDLQRNQLVVARANAAYEEQRGVTAVNDLRVYSSSALGTSSRHSSRTLVLKEVAHPRSPGEHELRHVLDDLGLDLRRHRGEPFR